MASTRYIKIIPGRDSTGDTIYFSFEAGVTSAQAGKYYIRYQVGNKAKVKTASFYIEPNGTYSTYEFKQTGLAPDTEYTINASLVVFANDKVVATASPIKISTIYVPPVAEVYYAKLIINGNGGTYNGSSTLTFDDPGFNSGWEGYADVPVDYDASYFTRKGYTLLGVDTSSSRTSPRKPIKGTYYIRSKSTNKNRPDSKTLYAIWEKITIKPWKWTSNVTKGAPFGLTAKEWNDFISYIKNYASINEISLSSTYLTDAKATRGNRMLESQANAMRNLLIQIGASPPAKVSPNSPITAAFVNGLKDAFNNLL